MAEGLKGFAVADTVGGADGSGAACTAGVAVGVTAEIISGALPENRRS